MKMLIGLTGKTGSGKSSAAKIFENCGAYVADCDIIAHDVLCDKDIKKALCRLFSEEILNSCGDIDRKALGSIVFSDKEKLAQLNGIVHPEIIRRALRCCRDSGKRICVIDGSELESSGVDKMCDHIVVITAEEETRLKRITERDGIDTQSALARIRAQRDYTKNAIFIDNNGNYDALEKEITALYSNFSGELND